MGRTISIKEIGKINKPVFNTWYVAFNRGEHCSLDDHWYNKNFVSKKLLILENYIKIKKKHWRKKFFYFKSLMNSNLKKFFKKIILK